MVFHFIGIGINTAHFHVSPVQPSGNGVAAPHRQRDFRLGFGEERQHRKINSLSAVERIQCRLITQAGAVRRVDRVARVDQKLSALLHAQIVGDGIQNPVLLRIYAVELNPFPGQSPRGIGFRSPGLSGGDIRILEFRADRVLNRPALRKFNAVHLITLKLVKRRINVVGDFFAERGGPVRPENPVCDFVRLGISVTAPDPFPGQRPVLTVSAPLLTVGLRRIGRAGYMRAHRIEFYRPARRKRFVHNAITLLQNSVPSRNAGDSAALDDLVPVQDPIFDVVGLGRIHAVPRQRFPPDVAAPPPGCHRRVGETGAYGNYHRTPLGKPVVRQRITLEFAGCRIYPLFNRVADRSDAVFCVNLIADGIFVGIRVAESGSFPGQHACLIQIGRPCLRRGGLPRGELRPDLVFDPFASGKIDRGQLVNQRFIKVVVKGFAADDLLFGVVENNLIGIGVMPVDVAPEPAPGQRAAAGGVSGPVGI